MTKQIQEVLCQDCLKVKPYTDERHGGLELCECGGEFCGCGSCSDAISSLKTGELDPQKLGLRSAILNWTPENGVSNL